MGYDIFFAKAAALLGAALAMGIGSIGPALGQGIIGMKSVEQMGKSPESIGKFRNAMLMAMGVVETSAIYAFLIALFLIYTGRTL